MTHNGIFTYGGKMTTEIIDTNCGKIVGEERENCRAFLGIRYARANRFEKPERVTEWNGVYEATAFRACCPQARAYENEAEYKNPFYFKEFRQGLKFTYDEDCLFLNIYAPACAHARAEERTEANAEEQTEANAKAHVKANSQKYPVLVFIHGGNFTKGSSDELPFDGEEYCKRGIVFVTLNYRLNVFGFFADGEHAGGNFGLYDQACAIEWIRENISAFGGDPENITLMGQSAGAMSVQSLICSPLMRGEIRRAIMLSGGGTRGIILPERKPDTAFWKSVIKKSGADSFEDFKTMPAKDVFYAWKNASAIKSLFATAPVVDGEIIDGANSGCAIPCIVGRVQKDMFPPELDRMVRRFAKTLNKNGAECYVYRFEHSLPGDDKGTFHSADLWYIIGALKNSFRPFVSADRELSDSIIDRFAAFMRTDSPNVGNNDWKPYKNKKDIFVFD